MNKNVAVNFGDGISPEVTQQSVKVLGTFAERSGRKFNFTYGLMGAAAIEQAGNPLPIETVETCLISDASLFANSRPINVYPVLHLLPPLKKKYLDQVDFVIYLELTGGIHFGREN